MNTKEHDAWQASESANRNHKGDAKTAWVVNYTHGSGKRRLKTFEKKKDADRYRTQVENEVEQGIHNPKSESQRIAAIARLYLEAAKTRNQEGRRMRDSHLRTLNNFFRFHIVPYLGGTFISELTWAEVDAQVRHRLAKAQNKALATFKHRRPFA